MTPERAAKLVARWVRFYTQELPASIAERRVEEVDADLRDHVEHERARGATDRRIALSVLSRMARGMTADVLWRQRASSQKGNPTNRLVPFLGTAVVPAALGVGAIVWGEADDAPGLVMLGLLLIVGAFVFAMSPALRRPSRFMGFIVGAIVLTAVGASVAGWLENNF